MKWDRNSIRLVLGTVFGHHDFFDENLRGCGARGFPITTNQISTKRPLRVMAIQGRGVFKRGVQK